MKVKIKKNEEKFPQHSIKVFDIMNQTHKIMRKPEINMKAHFVSRNKKK